MSQLILTTGLSVLLFGTCSPSIDQDARQAKLWEMLAEQQTGQADAAAAKQAAREQALAAVLARHAEATRRLVLDLEGLIARQEAWMEVYSKQVDSPNEETQYAKMLRRLDELRRLRGKLVRELALLNQA